jgi:hypothetical protein
MTENSALNDQSLIEISWLLEQDVPHLAPDAVWLSGKPQLYAHLAKMGVLTLSNDVAMNVVCRDCCNETIRPQENPAAGKTGVDYRGYCRDCGWIDLTREQAHFWQAQPLKIARWLASALQLNTRYVVESVIDCVLWRLGEIEHRRKRRTVFFGRGLSSSADVVQAKLKSLVAPGAEVIITTSDIGQLRNSVLADRLVVPLRAVVHIRKAGLVIENLDAYLIGPGPIETSDETSLRLMHTQRAVLVDGQKHKLSPQVFLFLKVLEDSDGDEVHKRHIASELGVPAATFRTADIFKRHKAVLETFVESDNQGNYWLKPDFVILERG